jgi:hypothetical protein
MSGVDPAPITSNEKPVLTALLQFGMYELFERFPGR